MAAAGAAFNDETDSTGRASSLHTQLQRRIKGATRAIPCSSKACSELAWMNQALGRVLLVHLWICWQCLAAAMCSSRHWQLRL